MLRNLFSQFESGIISLHNSSDGNEPEDEGCNETIQLAQMHSMSLMIPWDTTDILMACGFLSLKKDKKSDL